MSILLLCNAHKNGKEAQNGAFSNPCLLWKPITGYIGRTDENTPEERVLHVVQCKALALTFNN
jgi:hypothetical protein